MCLLLELEIVLPQILAYPCIIWAYHRKQLHNQRTCCPALHPGRYGELLFTMKCEHMWHMPLPSKVRWKTCLPHLLFCPLSDWIQWIPWSQRLTDPKDRKAFSPDSPPDGKPPTNEAYSPWTIRWGRKKLMWGQGVVVLSLSLEKVLS